MFLYQLKEKYKDVIISMLIATDQQPTFKDAPSNPTHGPV